MFFHDYDCMLEYWLTILYGQKLLLSPPMSGAYWGVNVFLGVSSTSIEWVTFFTSDSFSFVSELCVIVRGEREREREWETIINNQL